MNARRLHANEIEELVVSAGGNGSDHIRSASSLMPSTASIASAAVEPEAIAGTG